MNTVGLIDKDITYNLQQTAIVKRQTETETLTPAHEDRRLMGKKSKKKAAPKSAAIDSSGGSSEATSAGAGNFAEAEDLVATRACIECDACGAPSPQKKCAKCLSFYYCNRECQVSHWLSHKEKCSRLKKIYELQHKQVPGVGPTDKIDGPCVICLEETVTNPVTLDCGHVFCFECIGTYQKHAEQSSQESSCPYCRGELPDVAQRSTDRSLLYWDRAQAAPEGSVERKKFCDLTLAEQESAHQVYGFSKLAYLFPKAMTLSIAGDPKALLDITTEILSECQKCQSTLGDADILQTTKIWRAEALSDMGEYFEASEAYQATHEEVQLYGKTSVQIAMGQSRCFYELGKYDKAIDAGNVALSVARDRPRVHKYVALAKKAKGDIAGAERTIARAILHERPWDKDNLEKNLKIQRDLDRL